MSMIQALHSFFDPNEDDSPESSTEAAKRSEQRPDTTQDSDPPESAGVDSEGSGRADQDRAIGQGEVATDGGATAAANTAERSPQVEEVAAQVEQLTDVVENVVDYGVSSVELEAVGYPDVCHSHGLGWGHEKRQALASDANRRLLSQCFCEACRERAREWGLDVDRARDVVRSLLRDALAEPVDDPPSLADLADEHRAVDRLLAFRADTVETFVARLAAAAGSTTVNTYVLDPAAMAATGVRLADVEDHLDRVTAICYVDEPAAARERLRAVGERVALPVDAGISLDPDLVGSEADFRALVDAALDETDGEVSAYHHGLVTEAQLDWIERVLG